MGILAGLRRKKECLVDVLPMSYERFMKQKFATVKWLPFNLKSSCCASKDRVRRELETYLMTGLGGTWILRCGAVASCKVEQRRCVVLTSGKLLLCFII